jgi:hypothetical protein
VGAARKALRRFARFRRRRARTSRPAATLRSLRDEDVLGGREARSRFERAPGGLKSVQERRHRNHAALFAATLDVVEHGIDQTQPGAELADRRMRDIRIW